MIYSGVLRSIILAGEYPQENLTSRITEGWWISDLYGEVLCIDQSNICTITASITSTLNFISPQDIVLITGTVPVHGLVTTIDNKDLIYISGSFEAANIDFTADRVRGVAPLTVNFKDVSTLPSGFNTTWREWNFGDGVVINGSGMYETISHEFENPSSYTIILKINMRKD